MLTTVDNEFNPFTQYEDWLAYDSKHHYKTQELLALFSNTSKDLEDEDNDEELNRAMDEIVNLFNGKLFKKVTEDDFK